MQDRFKQRANLIKAKRKEMDSMSQSDLAKKVSCTLRTIQRIEAAEPAGEKLLKKITEILGLDDVDVIVESSEGEKSTEKIFRLRRVFKADELSDVLRINNLPIIHDYSPHIKGRETMNLVIEFFKKCWSLNEAFSEKNRTRIKESLTALDIDLGLAPILAGINKEEVGIFAKLFCTVKKSKLSLEEYEQSLIGPYTRGDYIRNDDSQERKLAFMLYAANIKNSDDAPYENPSLYKNESIKLTEEYLKKKFRTKWYSDEIYADDEIDTPFQSHPKQYSINIESESFGFKDYMGGKIDENKEYFNEFLKDPYLIDIRENYDIMMEHTFNYNYETGERESIEFDLATHDKQSFEDGQKQAAQMWNAWEIFNKRAPYWNNSWLSFQKKHSVRYFPEINNPKWFGPKNTIIKEYKRVIDPNINELSYVSDDGDTLEVTITNPDEYYIDDLDMHIDLNQDIIPLYQPTDEFRAKVSELVKKLEKGTLKDDKKIDFKDRVAYDEACRIFKQQNEELPF